MIFDKTSFKFQIIATTATYLIIILQNEGERAWFLQIVL